MSLEVDVKGIILRFRGPGEFLNGVTEPCVKKVALIQWRLLVTSHANYTSLWSGHVHIIPGPRRLWGKWYASAFLKSLRKGILNVKFACVRDLLKKGSFSDRKFVKGA